MIMKKKILFIILLAVVALIVAGSIYYKMNYIDTVSEYYKLEYTPSVEKEVSFGFDNYTEPKIEISRIQNYSNDSIAVVTETIEEHSSQKLLKDELNKTMATKNRGDDIDKIDNIAKIEALREMMVRQITILRFTHRAGYDANEIFKFIRKYNGNPDKLNKYCKENKISYAIYPISD
jgi:hypothetical protein